MKRLFENVSPLLMMKKGAREKALVRHHAETHTQLSQLTSSCFVIEIQIQQRLAFQIPFSNSNSGFNFKIYPPELASQRLYYYVNRSKREKDLDVRYQLIIEKKWWK